MSIHFILGGARSGKSAYAEQLAKTQAKPVVYIATAQADDAEMQSRIAHHQTQRPQEWRTLEVADDLGGALNSLDAEHCVIIDCLTLWMMTCFAQHPQVNHQAIERFIESLMQFKGDLLLVSNEISMGVVPMGALSRDYVDSLGRLHQQVAARADQVTLMVAGLPMTVK